MIEDIRYGKNVSLPAIRCTLNTTSKVPGTLDILNMCVLNERRQKTQKYKREREKEKRRKERKKQEMDSRRVDCCRLLTTCITQRTF